MTLDFQDFDGAVALDDVQQLQGVLGTGVVSGCAASLPSSTSPITIDVASGTVYVANTELTVSSGSVTLPDGDAQHPRKDIVYVDSNGALQSLQGTPREPRDGTNTPGTDRHVFQPEPPDLNSLSSIADAAVIAEIWVPAEATGTGDMTDSGVNYVRDRRLRPWASNLLTSGSIGTSDLSFDTATQSELDSHAADADVHHQDPTAGTGLVDEGTNQFGLDVVDSNTVTLSSGEATIDTGNAVGDGYDYDIFFGDTDGADVAGEKTETGGNHAITIVETDTGIGNPTVSYTIVKL